MSNPLQLLRSSKVVLSKDTLGTQVIGQASIDLRKDATSVYYGQAIELKLAAGANDQQVVLPFTTGSFIRVESDKAIEVAIDDVTAFWTMKLPASGNAVIEADCIYDSLFLSNPTGYDATVMLIVAGA